MEESYEDVEYLEESYNKVECFEEAKENKHVAFEQNIPSMGEGFVNEFMKFHQIILPIEKGIKYEDECVEFEDNENIQDIQDSEDNQHDQSFASPFGKGLHLHSGTKSLLKIFYDFLINLRDDKIFINHSSTDFEVKQALFQLTNMSMNTIYKVLR